MRKTFALIFSLVACIAAHGSSLPSHCRPGEFAILDANMSRVEKRPDGGISYSKTGKVLSLCADKAAEPFGSVAYRFGPAGKVELEVVASPERKFNITISQTTPHTGNAIVFFTVGKLTYYVATAIGQGRGVALLVFDGNRQIVDLFSGTEEDLDFRLGPAELSYVRVRSQVFQSAEARHGFE